MTDLIAAASALQTMGEALKEIWSVGKADGFTRNRRKYRDELDEAARDAVERKTNRDDFIKKVLALIALYYLLALLDGGNLAEEELTVDEWTKLRTFVLTANMSVTSLADDIYSGRYDGTEGMESLGLRLDKWEGALDAVNSYGQVLDRENPYLKWIWSPEKEHCIDCARLNGQVHLASEWRESGYYPKSYDLECRGFYCGCEWIKAEGPSMGEF